MPDVSCLGEKKPRKWAWSQNFQPGDHNSYSGCSYSRTAALHLVNEICHSNGEGIGCIPSLCVDRNRLAWLFDLFVILPLWL